MSSQELSFNYGNISRDTTRNPQPACAFAGSGQREAGSGFIREKNVISARYGQFY